MKIYVSESTDVQLDYLVAKCQGWSAIKLEKNFLLGTDGEPSNFSTDPAQGWPLVENEPVTSGPHLYLGWFAKSFGDATEWYGRTRLIASLRCYVASRLGDEVEVPDGLQ